MNPIPLFSPNILKMNRRFFRTQLIIERKPRELTRFGELILSFNTFSPKLISMPIDINLLRVSRGGSPFLSIPENKLHFEINRYKSVGGVVILPLLTLRKCCSQRYKLTCCCFFQSG